MYQADNAGSDRESYVYNLISSSVFGGAYLYLYGVLFLFLFISNSIETERIVSMIVSLSIITLISSLLPWMVVLLNVREDPNVKLNSPSCLCWLAVSVSMIVGSVTCLYLLR